MNCFDYPIDSKYLIRKKRKIKQQLLNEKCNWIEKKIAVLGGSTTNEIIDQLEIFLLNYGIKAQFYQSQYGKYWEDAIFGTDEIKSFGPDIIFIHTNWRNITQFPKLEDSRDDVEKLLDEQITRYIQMWDTISQKIGCTIIQNNFERPNYRLMGNRDVWDYRGRSNYISRLNQKMYEYAQDHKDFYINDLEYTSQQYGIEEWNSSLYWNMYGYAMCLDGIPYVAQSVANIVKSLYGKNKKALMLDLDNTLWGGIVGDDGVEGIKIGPETPNGRVYAEFQEYCKNLKNIGVILAVVSKNEEQNAIAGLNHPSGVLKPVDFVDIKANWNPKNQNILQIAKDLSLGVESFVFIDDNVVERDIVSSNIPEVAVPKMEKPENYIGVLDGSGFFETTILSLEDMKKTEMYHARVEASKEIGKYENYDEYLDSLQMVAYLEDFKQVYFQRIAQLTNKSNQFNLTTLRCSEDDVRKMQESERYFCISARLKDKFVDNGLVSVLVARRNNDKFDIILFLMSCRVLKRDLEKLMLNTLIDFAKDNGVSKIVGHYYPTEKNALVKDLYGIMGFEKVREDEMGNSDWCIDVRNYEDIDVHMQVIKDL